MAQTNISTSFQLEHSSNSSEFVELGTESPHAHVSLRPAPEPRMAAVVGAEKSAKQPNKNSLQETKLLKPDIISTSTSTSSTSHTTRTTTTTAVSSTTTKAAVTTSSKRTTTVTTQSSPTTSSKTTNIPRTDTTSQSSTVTTSIGNVTVVFPGENTTAVYNSTSHSPMLESVTGTVNANYTIAVDNSTWVPLLPTHSEPQGGRLIVAVSVGASMTVLVLFICAVLILVKRKRNHRIIRKRPKAEEEEINGGSLPLLYSQEGERQRDSLYSTADVPDKFQSSSDPERTPQNIFDESRESHDRVASDTQSTADITTDDGYDTKSQSCKASSDSVEQQCMIDNELYEQGERDSVDKSTLDSRCPRARIDELDVSSSSESEKETDTGLYDWQTGPPSPPMLPPDDSEEYIEPVTHTNNNSERVPLVDRNHNPFHEYDPVYTPDPRFSRFLDSSNYVARRVSESSSSNPYEEIAFPEGAAAMRPPVPRRVESISEPPKLPPRSPVQKRPTMQSAPAPPSMRKIDPNTRRLASAPPIQENVNEGPELPPRNPSRKSSIVPDSDDRPERRQMDRPNPSHGESSYSGLVQDTLEKEDDLLPHEYTTLKVKDQPAPDSDAASPVTEPQDTCYSDDLSHDYLDYKVEIESNNNDPDSNEDEHVYEPVDFH